MSKATIFKEPWIRAKLQGFCEAVGREVRPSKPQRVDLLKSFIDEKVSAFKEVRTAIAETKVELTRAQRPGSSTRAKAPAIEGVLHGLLSQRQRILSEAASSSEFAAYMKEKVDAHAGNVVEWQKSHDLMKASLDILARDRIPSVSIDMSGRRGEPDVAAVVEAVHRHVAAVPPPGALVLMGQEPLPDGDLRALFEPKHAAGGLDPSFSGAVRLAIAPELDRGRAAEVQGASLSRNALMMRLGPDRRPVDERMWRAFDDILPFGARMTIRPRMPYAIPTTARFSDLRTLLSAESWRALRDSATDRYNSTCVMCGTVASGEVRAEWTFNEPPADSRAFGVQTLVDIKPYCSRCSDVFFPEPQRMKVKAVASGSYVPTRDAQTVNPIMRRLSMLNRWPRDAVPDPLVDIVEKVQATFDRRSLIRWALDLSVVGDINISLHPDVVMHSTGWIMRKSDVIGYENGDSVHLTRIFGTAFVNSDGTRYFFQLPETHEVPWDTSLDQIWVGSQSAVAPVAIYLSESSEPDPAGPSDPNEEFVEVEEGPPIV